MKYIIIVIILLTSFQAIFAAEYYASPNGVATNTGSFNSPWDLQTAINRNQQCSDTLWLRGGVYHGKFLSTLNCGTVRSYTGEWAVIDGYVHSTLVNNLDATSGSFSVVDGTGFLSIASDEIQIDGEILKYGTHNGNNFSGFVRGASGSNNGAQPHNAGAIVVWAGNQFYVSGSNTTYRDFEVMNSDPNRDDTLVTINGRGVGICNIGSGNKFVNLISHDNLNGIFSGNQSSNSEFYGNLVYNNGTYVGNTGVAHGHGFYLENGSGYSHIYDDISVNAFNLGAQFYGVTASFVNGSCDRSVFANAGAPLRIFDPNKANYNLIYGTDSVQSATGSLTNSYFYHRHDINGYDLNFGYGAGVASGTLTGNYIIGGSTLLIATNTLTSLTATNNTLYSRYTGAQYTVIPSGKAWNWDNNVYHRSAGRTVFGISGSGLLNFSTWQSTTGFDAHSTETSTDIPPTVIINPNAYQAGRANIIVYNGGSSISVNLTGLVTNQSYTIHNAFDYFGATVTGIYNGSSVTIPLTNQSVAIPVGFPSAPATTCPDFCVFIVVPGDVPTAGESTISGNVHNGAYAVVTFTDSANNVYQTMASAFGNYSLRVPSGSTYVGQAKKKGQSYTQQIVTVNQDVTVNF